MSRPSARWVPIAHCPRDHAREPSDGLAPTIAEIAVVVHVDSDEGETIVGCGTGVPCAPATMLTEIRKTEACTRRLT